MLTIFSTPRAFEGHFAVIQRNAIRSWGALRLQPEIILFGDELGTAEVCRELGWTHVPVLARSHSGAPILADLLQRAQRMAQNSHLCYVNSDIILTESFSRAFEILQRQENPFLFVCGPWHLRVDKALDFNSPEWESELRDMARRYGKPPNRVATDLFVFPKGFYRSVPPFIVGQGWYDHWLLYRAYTDKILAVEATPFVFAVHQDHFGSSHRGPAASWDRVESEPVFVRKDDEIAHNRRLAGWWPRSFLRADLRYELQPDGRLRKRHLTERFEPRVRSLQTLPGISWLVQRTFKFRHRVGLYFWWWQD